MKRISKNLLTDLLKQANREADNPIKIVKEFQEKYRQQESSSNDREFRWGTDTAGISEAQLKGQNYAHDSQSVL